MVHFSRCSIFIDYFRFWLPTPTFAMITPLGIKVLGAFLGAVYRWLFIALDLPSLIALLALGISGFVETTHELFISSWTFQSVSQSLLSYMFAEAIAATSFTSYIANRLMSVKTFNGRDSLRCCTHVPLALRLGRALPALELDENHRQICRLAKEQQV